MKSKVISATRTFPRFEQASTTWFMAVRSNLMPQRTMKPRNCRHPSRSPKRDIIDAARMKSILSRVPLRAAARSSCHIAPLSRATSPGRAAEAPNKISPHLHC
eukprot:CAMPEP_0194523232 /NCGR_PEP_ID=MMETSP0253-20130528/58079_1 /TAXON_ID=2966 /ORGANISM="Noctiluca scintillans" /LENGTH=102 /DNA_ID=CAMNT_0039367755 /DNA_START=587 /DNA_END=892 /DNA_ORIENTATION=-